MAPFSDPNVCLMHTQTDTANKHQRCSLNFEQEK